MNKHEEIRITVIKVERTASKAGAISKALDPYSWEYGNGARLPLEPRAEPETLADQACRTQSIKTCGAAIATNTYCMGHQFVERRKPETDKEIAEAAEELAELTDFFAYAIPEKSWPEQCYAFGYDKAIVGFGVWEVLRNDKGEIAGLMQHPASSFRLTGLDAEATEAAYKRWDQQSSGWKEVPYARRFRRFIQQSSGSKRYFKELGDPRTMDERTGIYSEATPEQYRAGELIWDAQYDPTTPYGLPDWIPLWDDTESDRGAASNTRDYFDDGGIPLALIFTPGGTITGGARKALTEALADAKATGRARTKVVVMDSAPSEVKGQPGQASSAATMATPQVVKLNDLQQGDALFRQFRLDHHRRVRIAFRLPGLFTGEDDAANFATADIQMQMAEAQVFVPKRAAFDHLINTKILPELNARWYRYQSKGPGLQDNATWLEVLKIAIQYGAIRDMPLLRKMLSEELGYELPNSGEADLTEWEQMPPGFVWLLVQTLSRIPGMNDLLEALPTADMNAEQRTASEERVAALFARALQKLRTRVASTPASSGALESVAGHG